MTFKTKIVKSRKFSIFEKIILFAVLIGINYYLFFLDEQYQNTLLSVFFLILQGISFSLIIMPQLLKPKYLGELIIKDDKFNLSIEGQKNEISFSNIKSLHLKYSGYGSFWKSHTIYGNMNFLTIIDNKNQKTELEVIIKNKVEKEKLKSILNTPDLHDKFFYKPIFNTKLTF